MTDAADSSARLPSDAFVSFGVYRRGGVYRTLANQGERMPSPGYLAELISQAVAAHTLHPLSGKETRKFDRRTPACVHPLDCMAEIMAEPLLSEGDRAVGGIALLFHDVPEDTADRPAGLSPRAMALVEGMTFPGGTAEEMVKIWDAESFLVLLKLYDKVSNWKTMGWMAPEKRTNYRAHILRLRDRVVETYGPDLHIVKMAEALTR